MKRIIRNIVIVAIVFGLGMLAYKATHKPKPQPQAANSSKQQTTDQPTNNTPQDTTDKQLEQKIANWVKTQPGTFGVSVREVTGNKRQANYNSESKMVAASTYKLFVIYAVLKQGNYSLDYPLGGSTIRGCIETLLLVSSDECAYRLGNLIGWDNLDTFLNKDGFAATKLNNYDASGGFTDAQKITSPKDEAEIAWRLANNTLLQKDTTDFMLGLMKRQIWRERIPAGVPDGVSVADKPGFIYNIQNDVGMVYGPSSTYVVAILSDNSSAPAVADLSRLIYQHLN